MTLLIDEFDLHFDARSFLKTKYTVDYAKQAETRKTIVDAKLTALADAQSQSDARAASNNDCQEFVVLDDDDVPYRPVITNTAWSILHHLPLRVPRCLLLLLPLLDLEPALLLCAGGFLLVGIMSMLSSYWMVKSCTGLISH
jgi:hypothetical protein